MNTPKPLPIFTQSEIARFRNLVNKRGPDECWPWKGATTSGRYGSIYGIWYCHGNWRPHRVAWELQGDARQNSHRIPEGLTIDHVKAKGCTTSLCCNPAHLEPVTQSENVGRYFRDLPEATRLNCKCGNPRRPNGKDRRCLDCYNTYFENYRRTNSEKCRDYAKKSFSKIGRVTKWKRLGRIPISKNGILYVLDEMEKSDIPPTLVQLFAVSENISPDFAQDLKNFRLSKDPELKARIIGRFL